LKKWYNFHEKLKIYTEKHTIFKNIKLIDWKSCFSQVLLQIFFPQDNKTTNHQKNQLKLW
jgi:hypothetical protein